ncbi:hypothetical protein AURDEDRAFT_168874 [Auricularia subglabra TFB-10046 SS5]|nr:hypothetical protein AURDEDRAFT_168874 [Auricularia subglabra TFB-10046 SS5]
MDDPEIAKVVAALKDPATLATRTKRAVSVLDEQKQSGKAPNLDDAKFIYYCATQTDNTGSIVPGSQQARRFIREMYDEVAKKEDLQVALRWFQELRLSQLGIATQSWAVVGGEVSNYMDEVRRRLRLFLAHEHLVPVWDPPESWKAVQIGDATVDLTDHLKSLRIPLLALSEDGISMLVLILYLLGQYGQVDGNKLDDRIAELIGGLSNVTLVNTSGSGKTRLLLEVLCRQFGFYFTCVVDRAAPPHGSRDMCDFAASLDYIRGRRNPSGVAFKPKAETSGELVANVAIVQQIVDVILLARLMIFDMFLEICQDLDSMWSTFHPAQDHLARMKRAWVLLQAFPCLSDSGQLAGTDDIFRELVDRLQNLSGSDVITQIRVLLLKLRERHVLPEYLVFDEVQTVAKDLQLFR